jgi:hypothetical protein
LAAGRAKTRNGTYPTLEYVKKPTLKTSRKLEIGNQGKRDVLEITTETSVGPLADGY